MTKPESADSWRQMLTEFADRAAAIEAEILAVRERKRPLAVAAMSGDAKSRAEVTKLDRRITELAAEHETAGQAVEQAQAELRQAERREAIAAEAQRLERLRTLSEKRIAIAEKVETVLAALGEALAAMNVNAGELAGLLHFPEEQAEIDAVHAWRVNAARRLNATASVHRLDAGGTLHEPLQERCRLGFADLTDAGLRQRAEERVADVEAPTAA
ncbi:MAG: hypothetical protein KDE35_11370 [Geminicoccaceae bacterium]|nr:hypothetical protein [Geminicoccaceae bacterium]